MKQKQIYNTHPDVMSIEWLYNKNKQNKSFNM